MYEIGASFLAHFYTNVEFLCFPFTQQYFYFCKLLGRRADTKSLGLENIGVAVNPHNGKIICVNEETSVSNIYAIGDVMEGCPELTPVAIHAGKLLARRLYGESDEVMNYKVRREKGKRAKERRGNERRGENEEKKSIIELR